LAFLDWIGGVLSAKGREAGFEGCEGPSALTSPCRGGPVREEDTVTGRSLRQDSVPIRRNGLRMG